MAFVHTTSPLQGIAAGLSAIGNSILAFFEDIGRARAAKLMYQDLSNMSDAELSSIGLKRNEISRTIYAKVYDLR